MSKILYLYRERIFIPSKHFVNNLLNTCLTYHLVFAYAQCTLHTGHYYLCGIGFLMNVWCLVQLFMRWLYGIIILLRYLVQLVMLPFYKCLLILTQTICWICRNWLKVLCPSTVSWMKKERQGCHMLTVRLALLSVISIVWNEARIECLVSVMDKLCPTLKKDGPRSVTNTCIISWCPSIYVVIFLLLERMEPSR